MDVDVEELKEPKNCSTVSTLPTQSFDVVLADPPWQYPTTLGTLNVPYPTLTHEEMKDYKPNTNENAVLFMWVTATHMPHAIYVMDAWGFEFVRVIFVWKKHRALQGWYGQCQYEFVILGKKGKPGSVLKPFSGQKQHVETDAKLRHSQKPEEVQDRIEAMLLPDMQKLEMFARRPREGWVVWGNEV